MALPARDVRRRGRRDDDVVTVTQPPAGRRPSPAARRARARADRPAGRRTPPGCCGRCGRTGWDLPGHGRPGGQPGAAGRRPVELRRPRVLGRPRGGRRSPAPTVDDDLRGRPGAGLHARRGGGGRRPDRRHGPDDRRCSGGASRPCCSTAATGRRGRWPGTRRRAGLTLLIVDTRASHTLARRRVRRPPRATARRPPALLGVDLLRDVDDQAAALDALEDERVRRRVRHVFTEIDRVQRGRRAARGRRLRRARPVVHRVARRPCATTTRCPAPSWTPSWTPPWPQGALGARMTGGGFGGSAIALVPDDRVDAVAQAVVGGVRRPRLGLPPPSSPPCPAPAPAGSADQHRWLRCERASLRARNPLCPALGGLDRLDHPVVTGGWLRCELASLETSVRVAGGLRQARPTGGVCDQARPPGSGWRSR